MNRTIEVICAFLVMCLFTFMTVRVVTTVAQSKGVAPILKVYNEGITQCKDEECRQYISVFYARVLRELTSEVEGADKINR